MTSYQSIPEASALLIHVDFGQDNSNNDKSADDALETKSCATRSTNSKDSLELKSISDPNLPFYYGHRIHSDEQFNNILDNYVSHQVYLREFERIRSVRKNVYEGPPEGISKNARKTCLKRRLRKFNEVLRDFEADIDRHWKGTAQGITDPCRDARLQLFFPDINVIPANEAFPFGAGSLDVTDKDDNNVPRGELVSFWFAGMAHVAVDEGLVSEDEIDTGGHTDMDSDYVQSIRDHFARARAGVVAEANARHEEDEAANKDAEDDHDSLDGGPPLDPLEQTLPVSDASDSLFRNCVRTRAQMKAQGALEVRQKKEARKQEEKKNIQRRRAKKDKHKCAML